jgi:hypothetical protein
LLKHFVSKLPSIFSNNFVTFNNIPHLAADFKYMYIFK